MQGTEKMGGQEGKSDVACMDGAVPFDEMVFMEGVKSGDSVGVDWEIEDLSIGLINSRKISVKSLAGLSLSCEEICDEETAVEKGYFPDQGGSGNSGKFSQYYVHDMVGDHPGNGRV